MSDQASTGDAIPGTTICCFLLRSTFIDFQLERHVLQRHVYPQQHRLYTTDSLRRRCSAPFERDATPPPTARVCGTLPAGGARSSLVVASMCTAPW